MNKYLTLFIKTLTVSAFTVGGGFVIVPMLKSKFVDELGWLDEQEMLDITAIAQSSPGPIAVNCSVMIGYRTLGVWGAVLALFATIIPPLVIITAISYFYEQFRDNSYVAAFLKGMLACVAAVIADVVSDLGGKVVKERDILNIVIMLAAFVAVCVFGVNVIAVILCCVIIGIAAYLLKKGGKADVT